MTLQRIGLVIAVLCALTTAVRAQEIDASEDTENALDAMDKTNSVGHPDLYNEYAGMHDYSNGNFKSAFGYFLKAAQYADKPSQLSIGLMYLSGQGVVKDPVKAYGWVALAAERDYPTYEWTQEQIWEDLTPQQQRQAMAYQKFLDAKYGDLATKPRQLQAMHDSWAKLQTVNSTWAYILGAFSKYGASGRIYLALSATTPSIALAQADAVSKSWFWNPKSYFRKRDEHWMMGTIKGHGPDWNYGTVSVGKLQKVPDDSSEGSGGSERSSSVSSP
jgi:uncharacterized protein